MEYETRLVPHLVKAPFIRINLRVIGRLQQLVERGDSLENNRRQLRDAKSFSHFGHLLGVEQGAAPGLQQHPLVLRRLVPRRDEQHLVPALDGRQEDGGVPDVGGSDVGDCLQVAGAQEAGEPGREPACDGGQLAHGDVEVAIGEVGGGFGDGGVDFVGVGAGVVVYYLG